MGHSELPQEGHTPLRIPISIDRIDMTEPEEMQLELGKRVAQFLEQLDFHRLELSDGKGINPGIEAGRIVEHLSEIQIQRTGGTCILHFRFHENDQGLREPGYRGFLIYFGRGSRPDNISTTCAEGMSDIQSSGGSLSYTPIVTITMTIALDKLGIQLVSPKVSPDKFPGDTPDKTQDILDGD